MVRGIEPTFWIDIVYHTIDVLHKRYSDKQLEVLKEQLDDSEYQSVVDRNEKGYDVFIITDCRFNNELQPSPYADYYLIYNVRVKRDGYDNPNMTPEQLTHESELMALTEPDETFNNIIYNNGTMDDLTKECERVVNEALEWHETSYNNFLEFCRLVAEKLKEEQDAKE